MPKYCHTSHIACPSGVQHTQQYYNHYLFYKKKAIRIVTDSKYDEHTHPLFISLGFLKFYDLVKLEIGGYMYKYKNSPIFNRLLHNYNTRNRNIMIAPTHELSLFQNSLAYQGPKLWNSLTENLKSSRSVSYFKNQYKKILLNGYQVIN